MYRFYLLYFFLFSLFVSCNKTPVLKDGSNFHNAYYGAEVTYVNDQTGSNSTCDLRVQVENNQIIKIDFNDGSRLEGDNLYSNSLNSDGECICTSTTGKQYQVKINANYNNFFWDGLIFEIAHLIFVSKGKPLIGLFIIVFIVRIIYYSFREVKSEYVSENEFESIVRAEKQKQLKKDEDARKEGYRDSNDKKTIEEAIRKLKSAKEKLDLGLISSEDYEILKKKISKIASGDNLIIEEQKEYCDFDFNEIDPLFIEAAILLVKNQIVSQELIQSELKISYIHAEYLMEQLTSSGVICVSSGIPLKFLNFHNLKSLDEYLKSKGISELENYIDPNFNHDSTLNNEKTLTPSEWFKQNPGKSLNDYYKWLNN
jgi:hypothetical protein